MTAKSADAVVLASARPSTAIAKWFRQLGAICRLNCTLMVRYWKATLIQAIVLPAIAVIAIYAIQEASSGSGGSDGPAQLSRTPDATTPCITLAYTPQTPETTEIMDIFRTKNQLRMGRQSPLQLETTVISDPSFIPSRDMDIVPVSSESFLYQYTLDHPTTVLLGVAFTKQGGGADGMTPPINWAYQIYYNATRAVNRTVNGDFQYKAEAGINRNAGMDDHYGVYLPTMMRSVDEAIMSMLQRMTDTPAGKSSPATVDLDYSLRSYPIPQLQTDNLYDSIASNSFTMYSSLVIIPACITMVMAVMRVTREKESKVRESMEMMGLNVEAYWMAQWLTAWIMAILQSAILLGLGHAAKIPVFVNADPSIWLVFLTLFCYAMNLMGFFLATFCQRVGTAVGLSFALVVAALVTTPIIGMSWFKFWIANVKIEGGQLVWLMLSDLYIMQYFLPFFNFARFTDQVSQATSRTYDYTTQGLVEGNKFVWSNMTQYKHDTEPLQPYLPQPISAVYALLVNIVLFVILTWYFDQVIPKASGRRSEPWHFFVSRIPRAFKKMFSSSSAEGQGLSAYEQQQIKNSTAVRPYEGEPPVGEDEDVIAERERAVNCTHGVAVRISNLTKIYKKPSTDSIGRRILQTLGYIFTCGCCRRTVREQRHATSTKRAVDRLNLIAESGELLALLGPNGAGKSTTMQILYGVTPQDAGTAFLFHRSIDNDRQQIKATLGVCPQHDVLISDLTVLEHMQLYAAIKDLPADAWRLDKGEDAEEDATKRKKKNDDFSTTLPESIAPPTWIKSRLQAVQLWKDRHTYAGRLSGGMKRRLSTILATVGDPEVLILDEPTTGMDPVHRRHVWTFLAQFKRSRAILLTTHSMEEADALGDKVAILVHGHLKAIGNTTRLKNRFGNGYRVEIGLTDLNGARDDSAAARPWTTEEDVSSAIRSVMPASTLIDSASSVSAGVLVYGIPPDRSSLAKMSELTALLERAQKQGVIKHWGIAQSSLEEVFLSLVQDD
ncbi:ATP-binding cassette sub- A member 1 [Actinomortierella ambigua]|uniref:ATP-binding cassette sub- A member 1 n=1 Tax=Actinomortierella ambigua TaxID=1343610 RepID=A0A9P6PUQ5_9FUNG|nr:ATP-binding cassette sub- A member 1 [Actinomortierella ambigua]